MPRSASAPSGTTGPRHDGSCAPRGHHRSGRCACLPLRCCRQHHPGTVLRMFHRFPVREPEHQPPERGQPSVLPLGGGLALAGVVGSPIHLHCHFHGRRRYIHSIVVRTFPIARRYPSFCLPSEVVRQTLLRHRYGRSVPAPACRALSHVRESVLHRLSRRRILHGVLLPPPLRCLLPVRRRHPLRPVPLHPCIPALRRAVDPSAPPVLAPLLPVLDLHQRRAFRTGCFQLLFPCHA